MPTLIPDFYLVQSCLSTFQFNKNNIPNVCQGFVLLNIYIYKYSLPIICIQTLKVHQEFTTQSLIFIILMIYHWNVPHNTCCLFSKKSFCLLVLAKQMTLASSLRPLRICHNLSSFLGEVAPPVGWLKFGLVVTFWYILNISSTNMIYSHVVEICNVQVQVRFYCRRL